LATLSEGGITSGSGVCLIPCSSTSIVLSRILSRRGCIHDVRQEQGSAMHSYAKRDEYFTPRADPGGHTLLFCGGLDWYPNADAMVYFFEQIWPPLLARLPDLRVVVVGRRPPSWLTDLAKRDGRIQVTGFVDDVRPYFEQATVYVCPIRIGGGTRLKILDALAMGMPLIGTTFACSGISVGHEREVLLADTPEEFARQVQRALSDENLRARLALSGRAVVCEKYSWSVIGDSLSEAYRHAHEHAIAKNANNEEGR